MTLPVMESSNIMAHLEQAESHLAEIELLSSMYPGEDELVITDQLAVAELREYVEGATDTYPLSRPHILIKQKLDTDTVKGVNVTISCTYSSDYPNVLPEIAVRCPDLRRSQQAQLHSDMNTYLSESCCGDVCVLSAVEWVKDNVHLYLTDKSTSSSTAAPGKRESRSTCSSPQPQEQFSRLWIYSHHIYNKRKRKNILEWSKELDLSGFSMPGKPGIICVEGPQSACEDFWARVKVLTWKKIIIRHREDVAVDSLRAEASVADHTDSLRRFTGFEEAVFYPHGNRGNHMNLGQLYQYLNERGCGDVFQLYFGIEGR
ncbi:RWD domain-containing protein 2B [Oncorhynchus keta]|uniref:RWD domain-containing protein 2B n=1 Tax=Oncorhynchus keta TaxID=8018 RepID=UPI00227BEDD2|nr:RWD domain-containing protein 2B [Oncorhynchus keta]